MSEAPKLDVDALAQEIRRVGGKHDLGAGQLAEALLPFLSRALASSASPVDAVAGLCPKCAGTGRGNETSVACSKCHGTGAIALSAALTVGTETADGLEGLRIGNCDIDGASGEDDPVETLGATPSPEPSEQKAAELRQIEEMLDDGQGDDDGPQILPDFHDGMSVLAKVEACLFLLEKRRDVIAAYGDERLFDADAPMADGEIQMTAAEDVLAWLLIEKIGVPDDMNYSPKDAQETIAKTIDHLREYERAALNPSEQKAVAWQRWIENFGWQAVHEEDIEHYRAKGHMVRALFTGPPPSGDRGSVKVKPLEWLNRVTWWRAFTSIGYYTIDDHGENWSHDRFLLHSTNDHGVIAKVESLTIAKAAAQADYEKRIRSALTTEGADHE